MKTRKYILPLVLCLGLTTSCNSFLDSLPDNRTEIDNTEKAKLLLVNAYPGKHPVSITELSSDNVDEVGRNLSADQFYSQVYKWEVPTTSNSEDTKGIWDAHYLAIASANHALEAINSLPETRESDAIRGEAYICRAYAHFVLVNLFCQGYGATSDSDMGIPYMDHSETQVNPQYERGTVAEVYARIEEDIEKALPLIDNSIYKVPTYHFNQRAVYAFVTRFNLYYQKLDKVIEYASELLGSDASKSVRDWAKAGALSANANFQPDEFVSAQNPATLLVLSNYSSWPVVHGPYRNESKYCYNQPLHVLEGLGAETPWGNMDAIFRNGIFKNNSIPKYIFRKIGYYFEKTDPIANTGYPRMMYPAFTTDETLLCRAEAYALQGKYDLAKQDIDTFVKAFTTGKIVDEAALLDYFEKMDYYSYQKPTLKKKISPDFTVTAGKQENYIHAILYLRRILTLHEGLRWFDIKRYGITIERRISDTESEPIRITDTMDKSDLRRVIQLPIEVIDAGLPQNPR